MCFRPTTANGGPQPIKCAHCGKIVFPSDGILPSKCPFCREALKGEAATPPSRIPSPSAPVAAPKAPGVHTPAHKKN